MKQVLLLLSIFFFIGCSEKENDELNPVDLSRETILGKWKLTETYISPGGETTWQTVENGKVYDLHNDGTFELSEGECNSGTFELEDDKIHFHCSSSDVFRSFYIHEITNSTLEMSYIGCIEACIYRFKKQ